jgi:hypothetical protein
VAATLKLSLLMMSPGNVAVTDMLGTVQTLVISGSVPVAVLAGK